MKNNIDIKLSVSCLLFTAPDNTTLTISLSFLSFVFRYPVRTEWVIHITYHAVLPVPVYQWDRVRPSESCWCCSSTFSPGSWWSWPSLTPSWPARSRWRCRVTATTASRDIRWRQKHCVVVGGSWLYSDNWPDIISVSRSGGNTSFNLEYPASPVSPVQPSPALWND